MKWGIETSALYPWLGTTPEGNWTLARQRLAQITRPTQWLNFTLPIVISYLSVALGITWFGSRLTFETGGYDFVRAAIAVVFTVSHAFLPVIVIGFLLKVVEHGEATFRASLSSPTNLLVVRVLRIFVGTFAAFWFGIPIAALAFLTGWTNLAGALIYILWSKPGARLRTFVEYGSTSMAILLLIVATGGTIFTWVSFVVLGFQAILLAILERTMNYFWTTDRVDAEKES
jgi:hypothetical protein